MSVTSNKQKAIAILKCIETGNVDEIKEYINSGKYKQHNVSAPDGFSPDMFHAVFKMLNGTGRVNVVRAFEDGDYVFTHTEYDFFGPKIAFDIFRFENGLVVEHWDNLQDTPSKLNPSGHSMIDGTVRIIDVDKTEVNKLLIKNFFKNIVNGSDGSKIGEYISENVIQHAALLPDGLSASLKVASQSDYYKNVKDHNLKIILAEGNFVLAGVECLLYDKPAVYYDLFRVENGLIAERWDVMEVTLEKEKWLNQNGKF